MPQQASNTGQLKLQISNRLEEIPRLQQAVNAFLQERAAAPTVLFTTNLVLEEIITNIIKYGYTDQEPHTITITLEPAAQCLKIRVADDGREFNPLSAAPPDTSLDLAQRPIGGLGIHLVRHMVNALYYQRQANQNVLEMTIDLPA